MSGPNRLEDWADLILKPPTPEERAERAWLQMAQSWQQMVVGLRSLRDGGTLTDDMTLGQIIERLEQGPPKE